MAKYIDCGIVKKKNVLTMYVEDIKLEIPKEQFDALVELYLQMNRSLLSPDIAYMDNGEVHLLKKK